MLLFQLCSRAVTPVKMFQVVLPVIVSQYSYLSQIAFLWRTNEIHWEHDLLSKEDTEVVEKPETSITVIV